MRATKNLAILLLAAGCKSAGRESDLPPIHDLWVGERLRRAQVQEAARAERALYPHHFVTYSERLSPLGERQLALLAVDLAAAPGELVVRRGGADERLHAARLEAVRVRLLAAGLSADGFTLADGHPAGIGVTSERVVETLAEDVGSATAAPLIQGNVGGGR
jgi:hypothetical protein